MRFIVEYLESVRKKKYFYCFLCDSFIIVELVFLRLVFSSDGVGIGVVRVFMI